MTATELRPMNLGELLDRMFTLYRSHFVLFVGIMAMPQLFAVAISLFTQGMLGSQFVFPVAGSAPPDPNVIGRQFAAFFATSIIMGLVYWVVYSVALGATTFAVSDVYLGSSTSVRRSYERMRGRFWRLMNVIFSVVIRLVLVYMGASMGAVVLIALATATLGGGLAAGILGVFAVLAGIGVAVYFVIWLALGYSASIPAMLLENLKAGAAMTRSLALIKGNRGRVFLVLLLTLLITWAGVAIIQGPFLVATMVMGRGGQVPMWLTSISVLAGGLAGALCAPLMMIGLVLLYYDVRVRREAFDLQYMMSTLGTPSSPATPPNSPIGPA